MVALVFSNHRSYVFSLEIGIQLQIGGYELKSLLLTRLIQHVIFKSSC
jgi:hypothetical protein